MKHQFLCATHRQAMKSNPIQATRCWRNAYEAGQTFVDMHCHYDALPHLGCAYEVAEIILSQKTLETYDAIVLFTMSAASVTKCLNKLGFQSLREAILQSTNTRLARELRIHPELTAVIQHQIHALEYVCQTERDTCKQSGPTKPQLVNQAYFEQLDQRVLH